MSHIRRETTVVSNKIPEKLLEEAVLVVGKILEIAGVKISDGFYNFDTYVSGIDYHDSSIRVICGLDAEGFGCRGRFGGIGIGISSKGELVFLGTSQHWDGAQANQARQDQLQKQFEKVLPAAVNLAARVILAKKQGKKVEIKTNSQTRQLQLAVEV